MRWNLVGVDVFSSSTSSCKIQNFDQAYTAYPHRVVGLKIQISQYLTNQHITLVTHGSCNPWGGKNEKDFAGIGTVNSSCSYVPKCFGGRTGCRMVCEMNDISLYSDIRATVRSSSSITSQLKVSYHDLCFLSPHTTVSTTTPAAHPTSSLIGIPSVSCLLICAINLAQSVNRPFPTSPSTNRWQ